MPRGPDSLPAAPDAGAFFRPEGESAFFARPVLPVFLLFLLLFLLISGGRLNSSDAHAQLQQAMVLAVTGTVRTATPPRDTFAEQYWNGSPATGYYEKHDPGGALLMLPAAWISSKIAVRARPEEASDLIEHPPLLANFLVGITDCFVAAAGCAFLFAYFALTLKTARPQAAALGATLAFIFGTDYCVYAKSAWDVAAGAAAMCAVLYTAAVVLGRGEREADPPRPRDLAPLVVASLTLCLFRAEMLPFLICALCAVVVIRFRSSARQVWMLLGSLGAGVALLFALNALRTGDPFSAAKTGGRGLASAFSGDFLRGVHGNFFAPNHGIFWFAPTLLLAGMTAAPGVWKRVGPLNQRMTAIFGSLAVCYLLAVSKLGNWAPDDGSWGARFPITVLPILFAVAVHAAFAGGRAGKIWLASLVLLTLLINLPAILVNTQLVFLAFPDARRAFAPEPREVTTTWKALGLELTGHALPIPEALMRSEGRRRASSFPDLWWTRVFHENLLFKIIGTVLAFMVYVFILAFVARRLHPRIRDASH